ncbi:zinc finger protein OZF-like isoform X1 [Leptidea sinapis]|uniref:zinc finger protein OZF-like isoform X1 n=2 Tax=Leptidea sinapis TaxID=189913 RepID=UPI0021C43909|nr:zinc finger protein OZF-like isoform X1 [Leptidea sinapis]
MSNNIYLTALKFICGDIKHVCRICFASTELEEINLADNYIDYDEENVTFLDIIKDLGMYDNDALPQALCKDCANSVINTYRLYKSFLLSKENWKHVIHLLEKSLFNSNPINSKVQEIYLMINNTDNKILTSHNSSKDKQKVLLKLRQVIQRYRTKSENKSHFLCNECGKILESKKTMKLHIKSHIKSKYPCSECPKIFTSKIRLNEHSKRIHHPKLLNCDQCNEKFSTPKFLRIHNNLNHDIATCNYCNLNFETGKHLNAHKEIHFSYECQYCRRRFKHRSSCNLHTRTCERNNNKSKFICDICDQEFPRKNSLRIHMVTQHNFGSVFSCRWCGKNYECISRLNEHVVKHTKDRNYQCDLCGGKFVTKAALLYHTRIHTGETPYQCDLCEMSFISASRRSEHKQSKHFGPNKECPHCDKKFSRGNGLKKHIAKHFNPHSKLYIDSL